MSTTDLALRSILTIRTSPLFERPHVRAARNGVPPNYVSFTSQLCEIRFFKAVNNFLYSAPCNAPKINPSFPIAPYFSKQQRMSENPSQAAWTRGFDPLAFISLTGLAFEFKRNLTPMRSFVLIHDPSGVKRVLWNLTHRLFILYP